MPKPSDIFALLEKTLKIIGFALVFLTQAGILLAIPVGLLYAIIEPAFGPNPASEYYSIAITAGQFLLIVGGITCAIYVFSSLAEKFEFVASALRLLGYLLVGLIATGALVQCISGNDQECRESRYITC